MNQTYKENIWSNKQKQANKHKTNKIKQKNPTKHYSCIDIYAHSCLKPFLIGRKPCSNRKTHVQIMKFTCRLNMGFGRRHWSK